MSWWIWKLLSYRKAHTCSVSLKNSVFLQLNNNKLNLRVWKALRWVLSRRHWCLNRVELVLEKGSCHLTQIKSQIMKIVNTDHREMAFFRQYSCIGRRTERAKSPDLAQWRSPGLSCSAAAARLCSTMPDGVALLSQLDGNESDWRGCLERLPKIMLCVPLALSASMSCCLLVYLAFLFHACSLCRSLFNSHSRTKCRKFSNIKIRMSLFPAGKFSHCTRKIGQAK